MRQDVTELGSEAGHTSTGGVSQPRQCESFSFRWSRARTIAIEAAATVEIVTVYRALDGGIHHARCGQRIVPRGQRAKLEMDFYCMACTESVTLPLCVLERIPVEDDSATLP